MIESMNFLMLPSDQLLTFGQRALGIYISVNPTDNNHILAPFVGKALDSYNKFNKALERESKNPYTTVLAEEDLLRDRAFYGLRFYVEAYSFSSNEVWSAAAEKILPVFRKHGWTAPSLGYKSETAAITNITDELKSKYAAEITMLSATPWLDALVEAQNRFEQTQKDSVTRPDTGEPTIKDTRPVLVNALRALITFTDLHYSANPGNSEFAGYVKALNDLVLVTMTSVRANVTRQANEKKKGDQPGTN